MKRIRTLVVASVLGMFAAVTVPAPGLAHELGVSSADFSGNAFTLGAGVVHGTDDPIQHFHVEVYDGGFKFEGQRGRPVQGMLTNAHAVLTGWTNHGDGTCSHWQEIWESQSEFWTENTAGLTATFLDPYTGSMDVIYRMHGFRHVWEELEYSPATDTCLWEERDSDRRDHLGEATLEVGATWESTITTTGKGRKNTGEQVSTTVSVTTAQFNGARFEIIQSDHPPSPDAFSGAVRYEVAIFDYIDIR